MSSKLKTFDGVTLKGQKKIVNYVKQHIKAPSVICLYGDLGAGKTALAGSIINELADTEQVISSPTFNLVNIYDSPHGEIWHLDLYRLNEFSEIYNLGFEEALNSKIMIIEWPEIIEHLLPSDAIKIKIIFGDTSNIRDYKINNVDAA